jgi:CubicO group peptidase (beta-lactamase class C family)
MFSTDSTAVANLLHFRRLVPGVLLFGLTPGVIEAQDTAGYSPEQSREFHARWTDSNWDDGGELSRYVFLHMAEFWPHAVIHRSGVVRELPAAPRPDVASFPTVTGAGIIPLEQYVQRSSADGLIVVHRGRVVFEAYPRMSSWDKHTLMSVSKPLASTLIAILEDEGVINSSAPVDSYLPELIGSAWEGVAVRDVLDMSSGISCLEWAEGAYSDPDHCHYRYEAALGWLPRVDGVKDVRDYVAGLDSHRSPGEAYEYVSVNTFVLGWLAEAVTSRRYADLLAEKIWQRMGAESDALISTARDGTPVTHAGVSATLRDVARFGLLFTPTGREGPEPVVSERHLHEIQNGGRGGLFNVARTDGPFLVDGEPPAHNSWQWDWVMEDGDFLKGGFGGQGLFVSPSRDLVVAFFGTHGTESAFDHDLWRVARQLAKSGLFGG